jgi:PDZ domain-containing protein
MTTTREFGVDDDEHRAALRLMARSKRDAEAAALRCARVHRRVEIRSDGIDGPSAGLMFALGIVDRLERGAVTRGRRVAGTGTIAPDGRVGPVGRVAQKVQVAESAHADVFLVAASQADEAREAAVYVDVIGVRDLDEALWRLRARGCSSGSP